MRSRCPPPCGRVIEMKRSMAIPALVVTAVIVFIIWAGDYAGHGSDARVSIGISGLLFGLIVGLRVGHREGLAEAARNAEEAARQADYLRRGKAGPFYTNSDT